jgi:hypothetical protein
VEPLSEKINGSSGGGRDSGEDVVDRPHVVYKRKPVNSSYSSQCGLSGQLSQDVPKLSETLKRRRRSQSMENYIETLVVADQEMYKFHKKKTEHYLLVVSSVVSSVCILINGVRAGCPRVGIRIWAPRWKQHLSMLLTLFTRCSQ